MNELNLIYVTEIAKIPVYKIENEDGFLIAMESNNSKDIKHNIYKHMETMKDVINFINVIVKKGVRLCTL